MKCPSCGKQCKGVLDVRLAIRTGKRRKWYTCCGQTWEGQ